MSHWADASDEFISTTSYDDSHSFLSPKPHKTSKPLNIFRFLVNQGKSPVKLQG